MFMFRESDSFDPVEADVGLSNFTHFDTLTLGSPLSPLIMSLILHFMASVVCLYPIQHLSDGLFAPVLVVPLLLPD